MHDLLARVLRREEGRRFDPYLDSEGFWTVGYGHLIDRRKGGSLPAWIPPSFPLSDHEIEELLLEDIRKFEDGLRAALVWWPTLDAVRQVVLVAMAFQMGVAGVLGFHEMLAAVAEQRWQNAGFEMLESKWTRQTRGRSHRMSRAMISGAVEAFDL